MVVKFMLSSVILSQVLSFLPLTPHKAYTNQADYITEWQALFFT